MAHATAAAAAAPAVISAAAAAATAASSPQLIPPVFHAIAGALGGSLALLLLYPLERARIEMQKNLAKQSSSSSGSPHSLQPDSALRHRRETNVTESSEVCMTTPVASVTNEDPLSSDISDTESVKSDEFVDALTDMDEHLSTSLTISACVHKLWIEKALYRGVAPIVATLAISNFVFFYVNEFMKRLIFLPTISLQKNRRRSNSYRSLLASCVAGICNVLITNPLWVANLRIVTGESQSSKLIPEMINVARVNGASHLWSGTGASLLLVSNPVIQFFLYDLLKGRQLVGSSTSRLNPIPAFLTGALAKAIATVITYPLQVTQTILRMQHHPATDRQQSPDEKLSKQHQRQLNLQYSGMWDCFVKVYGRDGIAGLFTGMRAKLLQTVLTAAFTFLTYEQIVTALYATHLSLSKRKTPDTKPCFHV